MEPVISNNISNSCPDPISSNCVTSQVPLQIMPCINLCGPVSQTQFDTAMGLLVCNLLQQLQLTQAEYLALPAAAPPLNFSGLNLGCLYSPTITKCSCPTGYTYIPDPTGLTIGTCSNGCPAGSYPGFNGACVECSPNTPCPPPLPTCTTTTNPIPAPTTLVGILQLIVNKLCNCCP